MNWKRIALFSAVGTIAAIAISIFNQPETPPDPSWINMWKYQKALCDSGNQKACKGLDSYWKGKQ